MHRTVVRRALELAAESSSIEEVRLKLLREGHFSVAPRIRCGAIKRQIAERLICSRTSD